VAGGESIPREAFHDHTCFLCQQSAEKYLKAPLQEIGQAVPRTHDLEVLLERLQSLDRSLAKLRRAASILTPYAVEYRYPGIDATKRRALAALRHSEKVRAAVRNRLGLSA
jgi:HEPN domain-containing protein